MNAEGAKVPFTQHFIRGLMGDLWRIINIQSFFLVTSLSDSSLLLFHADWRTQCNDADQERLRRIGAMFQAGPINNPDLVV